MVNTGQVRVSASTNCDRDVGLLQTRQDEKQKKAVRTRMSEVSGTSVVPKGFEVGVTCDEEEASGTQIRMESEVEDSYWILLLSTGLCLCLFEEFAEEAGVELCRYLIDSSNVF